MRALFGLLPRLGVAVSSPAQPPSAAETAATTPPQLLAALSQARDEAIFERYGRPRANGIVTAELPTQFSEKFGQDRVFVIDPTPLRPHLACVTGSLATPWEIADDGLPEDPREALSGLGFEIALELAPTVPLEWSLDVLFATMNSQRAAQRLLRPGIFLPVKVIGVPRIGNVEAIYFLAPPTGQAPVELRSGRFEILRGVGITAEEAAFSMTLGADALAEQLLAGPGAVTDPARDTVPSARGTVLPAPLRPLFDPRPT